MDSARTGIEFNNALSPTPELNILNYIYYYNGGGVATGDFNNDGLQDLYFTANQSADKLYLNNSKLTFSDITSEAGIDNSENWTTGVTTVDINQDGFLDIYVCKVNYKNIKGHNRLYVNNGLNSQGIPTFTEKAEEYGLAFSGFSTQATFFDYDGDADLDMFLLNHSVNPNQNYGKGGIRDIPNQESGDKLYENVGGFFKDVSEMAGIIQSKIGYGLGVAISDLNNDGHPDIYVGNDFFENDYLYFNNGDKTFDEIIQKKNNAIGHTTHFSMGNDVADLNNDGYTDIVSVDMLPEDLQTYKTSGTEFNYQIYQNYIGNGYAYQFMQNVLQQNNGNGTFSEIGYYSGISASEWSWSPLIADYNNDGYNDLFVTNGIPGATNDMDFINFIANETIQKSLGQGMDEQAMEFIDKIPKKKEINCLFLNNGSHFFEDVSKMSTDFLETYSNGGAYVDLDNDGDLDIVVNNINDKASILLNTTSQQAIASNYITIQFQGTKGNIRGIGAKAILYSDSLKLFKENFIGRGYLSSVAPELHFGLGKRSKIDSLHIIWPDGAYETAYEPVINRSQRFLQKNAAGNFYTDFPENTISPLTNIPPLFTFEHKENTTLEFNRDPLIPFALSNEGPGMAIADINNDGLEDIFICGAKSQSSQLLIAQKDGSFVVSQESLFNEAALSEDVAAVIFDANGDDYLDLIVVSGGNEFTSGEPIIPRLYINSEGVFEKSDFPFSVPINASGVAVVDFDNDGDLDLSIISSAIPQKFGHHPAQHLFQNNGKGVFTDITTSYAPFLGENNMSASTQTWIDLDGNNFDDLILAGDWSPITILFNDGNTLTPSSENGLDKTNGFWNSLNVGDFDNDGDIDIVAGNWGLNSRLKATSEEPIRLYRIDVDDNGSTETITTYFYNGEETTLASKDELVKQLPGINKKYLSYADFAAASINEIFSEEKLKKAYKKVVFELASCYFENTGNNQFIKHQLPFKAQLSSVNDILVEDFNADGFSDLLLVGNNFEISTQLSRLDASHGVLLLNNGKGLFSALQEQKFDISGACRTIEKLTYNEGEYLVITRNNDQPLFLRINY